jgi:hypothetical protein
MVPCKIPVTDSAMKQSIGLRHRRNILPSEAVHINSPFAGVLTHWKVDLARIEQVCNRLVVDLEIGTANLKLKTTSAMRIRRGMFLSNSIEQVFQNPRNQSAVLAAGVLNFHLWALHGVRLTTTRLTVGKN